MTQRDPLEQRLRRLRPATPSAELKQRVLREASHLPSTRPSRVEMLWFSRPLRVAAAVLVVALALFSIVEDRLTTSRLERAFGKSPVARDQDFEWVSEELGYDLGARARYYRIGRSTNDPC